MDIIQAALKSDVGALRRLLEGSNGQSIASADVNFVVPDDGRTALHVASSLGNMACLEVLLRHPNTNIDAVDHHGNTPLHLAAACRDMDALRMLLSYGADLFIKNKAGNRPNEYTQDETIESFLTERMSAVKSAAQWKKTLLGQIDTDLPHDSSKLKALCLDLLINQSVFEDRCKEAIYQLIEERHVVLYKNRLLEQAAGIPDQETGEKYIGQLQYWQDENERLTTTISYLKLRIQVLETTAVQQEEYYKHNLAELSRQQKEQIQAIFKRAEETERAFLSYQKKHSEELAKANQIRAEYELLKDNGDTIKGAPKDFEIQSRMQKEIFELRQQLSDAQAQQVTFEEKIKLLENLKSLTEKEAQELRDEIDKLRKGITEKVMSQIESGTEEQSKKDEKDESAGDIIFVKGEGNTGHKSVKAGTIDKLIERLVDPKTYDNQYLQAILLTHTVYVDSLTLLNSIIKICNENLAALKVVNIIKYWVEQYWSDFQSNSTMLETLNAFVDSLENQKLHQMLKTCITRKLTKAESSLIDMPTSFPKPIVPKSLAKRISADVLAGRADPKNSDTSVSRPMSAPWTFGKRSSELALDDIKLKLVEIDPLEIARQLTLIEFELFNAIKAR
eukprot:jgi/Hompol1/767/HPOL_001367-RA